MGLVGIARGNAIPFHDVRFVVSGLVVEECTASRFTTVAAAVHPPLSRAVLGVPRGVPSIVYTTTTQWVIDDQ